MTKGSFIFGKIKEKEVIRFLDQVLQLIGNLAKSTYSSKATADLGTYTYKMLMSFFSGATESSLSISELHGQIQVNETPLYVSTQDEAMVEAFIFFMLEHNLRKITFQKSVKQDEFMKFMERLAPNDTAVQLPDLLAKDQIVDIQVEQQVVIPHKKEPDEEFDIGEDAADAEPLRLEETKNSFNSRQFSTMRKSTLPDLEPPPENTRLRQLNVDVLVGRHRLDGAMIKILNTELPPFYCRDQRGAMLNLEPGEYELEIQYESYKVKRRVVVPSEQRRTDFVVDLQKIFDY